ncbi:MAG: DUF2232 domain-containing protein [Bacillota bacterium]|nr:DUF2232 domain-containing protein [Bacillota bacterium]
MFLRDEEAMNYFAGVTLLTFPGLGIYLGTWGAIWEMLILLAVFLFGRRRGLVMTMVLVSIGYAVPLIIFGGTVFNQITLVPLAGLLGVFGWQRRWPVNVTFFWSALVVAVLGAIPTLSFLTQGFDSKVINDMINSAIQQYDASGLLTVIQQQGMTEGQIRDSLQQVIHFFGLIIPSLSAIVALAEYGLVFYVVRRWFKDEEPIPFIYWRLPWYAVWGGILGIVFYLLGDRFSWSILNGLGINLMVVYGSITLVLGVSVYLYMLRSPRIPRVLKFTIILASFVYFFFSLVSIIMFGLFDLVFNFRHLPEES